MPRHHLHGMGIEFRLGTGDGGGIGHGEHGGLLGGGRIRGHGHLWGLVAGEGMEAREDLSA